MPADDAPRLLRHVTPPLSGDDVRSLQERLRALGYAIVQVDGIFGAETDAALRTFQKAAGLIPDGIAGEKTLRALGDAEKEGAELAEAEPPEATKPGAGPPEGAFPPFADDAPFPPAETRLAARTPGRETLLARFAYEGSELGRGAADREAVRDLQRHLRAMGYLRAGIDGDFGPGTESALMALQDDLLHNQGADAHGGEGAPVRVADYRSEQPIEVTGRLDAATAACIREILADPAFPLLPFSDAPDQDNERIGAFLARAASDRAPIPFVRAIIEQESGGVHFRVPRDGDEDAFIVVGLDRNDPGARHRVTSRGYGAGQYTLFHHPPRREEIDRFMLDPAGNIGMAIRELREKFDHFVNGRTPGTQADDRIAEFGTGPSRACRHAPGDPRHMTDCAACLREAAAHTVESGVTPLYPGAGERIVTTQYHTRPKLERVPDPAGAGCDWPYAVRRYNGSGPDSYWYQAEVLLRMVGRPPA